jgi:hypothetical protein
MFRDLSLSECMGGRIRDVVLRSLPMQVSMSWQKPRRKTTKGRLFCQCQTGYENFRVAIEIKRFETVSLCHVPACAYVTAPGH